jgi:hypothetical protein
MPLSGGGREGEAMTECTHTSDWWKQMIPCICCSALYSDDEAEQIANASSMAYREFTADQQAIIARHEMEDQEP